MFVVDFSQICIASYMTQVSSSFDNVVEMETFRAIALNSIRAINMKFRNAHPGSRMVIAVDSPNSWRKQIFPYYKANRAKAKAKSKVNWTQLVQCIKQLQVELAESFPYQVMQVKHAEADDIIGSIVRLRTSCLLPTIVVSGDHDFIQLQIDNSFVRQYDNVKDRWVTADDPKKKLFEHVIRGDTGDGIPNVLSEDNVLVTEGVRQKKIMTTALESWWENGIDFDKVDKTKLSRNIRLVDLRKTPNSIYEQVVAELNSFKPPAHIDIFAYCVKHQLKVLSGYIGDFRP